METREVHWRRGEGQRSGVFHGLAAHIPIVIVVVMSQGSRRCLGRRGRSIGGVGGSSGRLITQRWDDTLATLDCRFLHRCRSIAPMELVVQSCLALARRASKLHLDSGK